MKKQHMPCKGKISILPLQDVYFQYLYETQGDAIGLGYIATLWRKKWTTTFNLYK